MARHFQLDTPPPNPGGATVRDHMRTAALGWFYGLEQNPLAENGRPLPVDALGDSPLDSLDALDGKIFTNFLSTPPVRAVAMIAVMMPTGTSTEPDTPRMIMVTAGPAVKLKSDG